MAEPDFSKAVFKVDKDGKDYILNADLRIHIESNDYFATLATILGFIEDITREHEQRGYQTGPLSAENLKKLRSELLYLHTHYKILPKDSEKTAS